MDTKQIAYLGLDVGGTNIAGALVNQEGQIVAELKLPTRATEGQDVIIGQMLEGIKRLLQRSQEKGYSTLGIGLGIPGPARVKEGLSLHSPNLFWENVPIVKIIQESITLPVYMDNDVRCAAIGEKYFGSGKGVSDVICVALGTGVGSGIFINDCLLRGAGDIAGEVGHICMNPLGPRCNCGNYGCLEAYVGAPNIARRTREKLATGRESLVLELAGGDPAAINPELVTRAALAGDELAGEIIQETAQLIGLALANTVNLFNPSLLIIGGGVAKAGDILLEPIKATIKDRAMREHAKMVEIVPAKLGEHAGVIGAAWLSYLAMQEFFTGMV